MRSTFFIFLAFLIFSTGCRSNSSKAREVTKDTAITPVTAITRLVLDSNAVEEFISKTNLDQDQAGYFRNFYISRNYQYAWFTEDGLAEQAKAFWNLRNHYVEQNRDTTLFDRPLQNRMDTLMAGDTSFNLYTAATRNIELKLTHQFFTYAQNAYAGKLDPGELQWHIPRKKIDPVALLDSLVQTRGQDHNWEPVNNLYLRMRNELEKYNALVKSGGWAKVSIASGKKIKPGATDSIIPWLKQRLSVYGYIQSDSSKLYDDSLAIYVGLAQKSFGFSANKIINAELVNELSVPIERRVEQLLINMERMRWLPSQAASEFIVVNIPEFRAHIFEEGKEALAMDIVVGKAVHQTVIFTGDLKYVVFSPYWNVPSSITRNEIMPAMKKNSNYLARNNMEITGYNGSIPVIRQRPGGSNSLGLVKFLFPNSYNIYLHDTPAKSLFGRDRRDFSHGCIRLSKPFDLAKHLLRKDTSWTDEKIKAAMNKGEEKWVTLSGPVPVFITYFTSWVSNDGILNFRKDIYGHDEKLVERMFP